MVGLFWHALVRYDWALVGCRMALGHMPNRALPNRGAFFAMSLWF